MTSRTPNLAMWAIVAPSTRSSESLRSRIRRSTVWRRSFGAPTHHGPISRRNARACWRSRRVFRPITATTTRCSSTAWSSTTRSTPGAACKAKGADGMSLKAIDTIAIPNSTGSSFDHGAFDPKSRRIFVAHTGRDGVEVIDHDSRRHIATLPGFKEAAGVVADDGIVLVTNRGAASLAFVDAISLETRAVFKTGPRPNGVAIASPRGLAIAASIGDGTQGPKLHVQALDGHQEYSIDLPGAPRWCVTDAAFTRVFLAIREPSMILVARLSDLKEISQWRLSPGGAHGLDIDHKRGRLYVACDDAILVEVNAHSGETSNEWPIAGAPDVTF